MREAMTKCFLLNCAIFTFFSPLGSVALAHAHLVQSTPAKEAAVASLPKSVVLRFSEALEPAMCKIDVTDVSTHELVSAKQVPLGEPGDGRTIQIPLSQESGPESKKAREFEVSWKAVSKDTHTSKGSFRFRVQP